MFPVLYIMFVLIMAITFLASLFWFNDYKQNQSPFYMQVFLAFSKSIQ